METNRPRPIGVTLLAIVYMCFGFGGCLLLPIFLLFFHILSRGAATQMWRVVAADTIADFPRLARLIPVGPSPFFVLWFLVYALHAAIGIGFLKLRNWARRGMEGLGTAVALVILILAISSRVEFQIVAPLLIILASYPAWLIWYMERPNVRWAFRRAAPVGGAEVQLSPPRGMSIGGIVWTVSALLVTIVGTFAISLMSFLELSFRSSDVYRDALLRAGQSPCFVQRVGSPLAVGLFVSGSMNETNQEGDAELSIPVHGPRGEASVDVAAERHGGVWEIKSLSFMQDDREFSILPEVSEEGCR